MKQHGEEERYVDPFDVYDRKMSQKVDQTEIKKRFLPFTDVRKERVEEKSSPQAREKHHCKRPEELMELPPSWVLGTPKSHSVLLTLDESLRIQKEQQQK